MRRLGFILHLSLGASILFAQTQVAPHWSPYNAPRELPAGVKVHIISEGESLWRIARTQLGDPYLWPQIFAKNDYIKDPDLIYPGDPLIMDIGVLVNDQTIAQSIDDDDPSTGVGTGPDSGAFAEMEAAAGSDPGLGAAVPQGEFGDDAATQGEEDVSNVSEVADFGADAAEFVILPAAERSDMDCSTFIQETTNLKEPLPSDILVIGGETEGLESFSPDQVVYIDKGALDGIKSGSEFAIQRRLKKVYREGAFFGFEIDQVGRAKIVAVQDHGSTVLLSFSCYEVLRGDFLVPYQQEPIPLITEVPAVDKFVGFDSTNHGYVLSTENHVRSIGRGSLMNIDLGTEQNVAPGDTFLLFKPNPGSTKTVKLPELFLGYCVALRANPKSTVAKIISAVSEIQVGDFVIPSSQVKAE